MQPGDARAAEGARDEDKGGHTFPVGGEVARKVEGLRGAGVPLGEEARSGLEASFGADLSDVRVHTDERADALARRVNADAFSAGRDVFFRSGSYRPESPAGRSLLAHEVTHVLGESRPDAAVTSVKRQATATPDAPVSETVGTEEGNPNAPADAGTSTHPQIKWGSKGPAVEELQEKLNNAGADPALVVDGIFGPKTHSAVVSFQGDFGLATDGIVGPITWGMLDSVSPGSNVGRVEKAWSEQVGGQTYGMTSRFTQRLSDDELRIQVKLKFTGVDPPGLVDGWFTAIRDRWNRFDAVNQTSGETVAITFAPSRVTSGQDNAIKIHPGNDRADAANWYAEDPDGDNTAAHEFGHMVGLEDEYQRDAADYERLMGVEPPEGITTGDAAAGVIALELHTALHGAEDTRAADALAVVQGHDLQQGDFAQEVATSYQTQFGIGVVQDIVDQLADEDEFFVVDPFTYSSGATMGVGSNHDHLVEPRHMRGFVAFVQAARGGLWEAVER